MERLGLIVLPTKDKNSFLTISILSVPVAQWRHLID